MITSQSNYSGTEGAGAINPMLSISEQNLTSENAALTTDNFLYGGFGHGFVVLGNTENGGWAPDGDSVIQVDTDLNLSFSAEDYRIYSDEVSEVTLQSDLGHMEEEPVSDNTIDDTANMTIDGAADFYYQGTSDGFLWNNSDSDNFSADTPAQFESDNIMLDESVVDYANDILHGPAELDAYFASEHNDILSIDDIDQAFSLDGNDMFVLGAGEELNADSTQGNWIGENHSPMNDDSANWTSSIEESTPSAEPGLQDDPLGHFVSAGHQDNQDIDPTDDIDWSQV